MYSTKDGIESAVFKAQGEMVEISTQQIISCDTTDDGCYGGDLFTVFNYVKDAGSIDCIDNDADYPASSYGGCSGDYYGHYYGIEQALWSQKTRRSVPKQGCVLSQRVPLQITSRTASTRNMT